MDSIQKSDFAAGDVVLYHGNAVLSRLIRLFDGTEVNHAAIYLGDGAMGEAIGKGLSKQSIPESLSHSEYVIARRLKTDTGTMQPVLDKAAAYLSHGSRYGYEQIVLLAFLGLTRKLAVNSALKWLMRKILDEASSWLMKHGNQQPMICSEFVYRCYDEALPALQDPYALDVNPFPAMRGIGMAGMRSAAPVTRRGSVHRDSLLAWAEGVMVSPGLAGSNVLIRSLEGGRGQRKAKMLPTKEQKLAAMPLEKLAEHYLAETKRPPAMKARSFDLEASLRDADMLTGIRNFSEAWYRATVKTRSRAPESWPAKAAAGEVPSALDQLLRTAADFVTPGDLYKCENLYSVGRMMK